MNLKNLFLVPYLVVVFVAALLIAPSSTNAQTAQVVPVVKLSGSQTEKEYQFLKDQTASFTQFIKQEHTDLDGQTIKFTEFIERERQGHVHFIENMYTTVVGLGTLLLTLFLGVVTFLGWNSYRGIKKSLKSKEVDLENYIQLEIDKIRRGLNTHMEQEFSDLGKKRFFGLLASLSVTAQNVNGGTGITTSTARLIDPGVKNYDSARFRLQETTGNEDVELLSVKLKNIGSAANEHVSNIRFVDQSGVLVGQLTKLTDEYIEFVIRGVGGDCGPRGGYLIKEGQLRDFVVRVDFTSEQSITGKTLNWIIEHDYDVRAIGVETGVGVRMDITANGTSTNGTMVRNF